MRYTGGVIGKSVNQSQKIEFIGSKVISFIGYTGTPGANATINFTSTIGTLKEDDLVIVGYASGALVNNNISMSTTGYSTIFYSYQNGTYDTNFLVASKRMGLVPDTEVVFNPTGAITTGGACIVMAFRNVDKARPFDVANTTATSISSFLADAASITPITKNAMIVVLGGGAMNGSTQGDLYFSTDLQNFTAIVGPESDADAIVGGGIYKDWQPANGTVDPTAWTSFASTAGSYAAITIALRPQRPSGVITLDDIYVTQIN